MSCLQAVALQGWCLFFEISSFCIAVNLLCASNTLMLSGSLCMRYFSSLIFVVRLLIFSVSWGSRLFMRRNQSSPARKFSGTYEYMLYIYLSKSFDLSFEKASCQPLKLSDVPHFHLSFLFLMWKEIILVLISIS